MSKIKAWLQYQVGTLTFINIAGTIIKILKSITVTHVDCHIVLLVSHMSHVLHLSHMSHVTCSISKFSEVCIPTPLLSFLIYSVTLTRTSFLKGSRRILSKILVPMSAIQAAFITQIKACCLLSTPFSHNDISSAYVLFSECP